VVLAGLCVVSLVAAAPLFDQSGNPAAEALLGAEGTPTPAPEQSPNATVGAVQRPYWRSMSYDRYTGTGWERSGNATAYDGPLAEPVGDSRSITLRLRAESEVQTLPAPWKPTRVGSGIADRTRVYDAGLQPASDLQPGTTFTVTSRLPNWTVSDLRTAGTDYPDRIERRYTQLPVGTPERVRRLADNLTADADTPYAEAVAVERWLERTKNYSLSARRPPEQFADTFLFEMDRGYCQYFATGMVALLRAEGIPARYVSGYSPFERTDFGTYAIRGKYAHAWVEVYFPGEGWVTFDPTPAAERAAARGSVERDLAPVGAPAGPAPEAGRDDGSASARDVVARAAAARRPPATDGAERVDRPAPQAEGVRLAAAVRGPRTTAIQASLAALPAGASRAQADEEWVRTSATVEVEGRAVPGNEVTVIVKDESTGRLLPDRQVRFNGDPVGVTDASGRVEATVPYAEQVRISVFHPTDGSTGGNENGGTGSPTPTTATPTTGTPGGTPTGDRGGRAPNAPRQPRTIQDLRYNGQSVPLGGPITNLSDEVVFTVTVLDGVERFRTGAGGHRTATADGSPLLRQPTRVASRGSLSAAEPPAPPVEDSPLSAPENTTLLLNPTIDVSLSPQPAAPGEPVVVRTAIEGVPVEAATVSVAGETALTNASGVAELPAPYRPRANVTVRRDEASGSAMLRVRTGEPELSLPGDPTPGENVTLRARVGGEPLPAATVRVNGQRRTTTDDTGRATIRVPYAERLTVSVRRDRVRANRSLDLPTRLRVRPRGLVYPGGSVAVHVRLDGAPVENATVFRGGERVGRTGADGRLAVQLPVALSADLGARRGAATGTAVVSLWLWWLVGGALLLVALLLAARRGLAATELRLDRSLLTQPLELLRLLRVGLILSVLLALRAVTRRLGGPDVDVPAFDEADRQPPGVPAPRADENAVYRAWARFAAGFGEDAVRRPPGTVAEEAIARGLPADAVARLREAFESVRYGGRDPEAVAPAAREALRELERESERLAGENRRPDGGRSERDRVGGERQEAADQGHSGTPVGDDTPQGAGSPGSDRTGGER
jgi:transglutaminase-like putative cysteine protease